MLGRKILERKDSKRILCQFAELNEGEWTVKPDQDDYRTECGRRMFSARMKMLWKVLNNNEKEADIKRKAEMDKVKEKIKTIDTDWVFWGTRKVGGGQY